MKVHVGMLIFLILVLLSSPSLPAHAEDNLNQVQLRLKQVLSDAAKLNTPHCGDNIQKTFDWVSEFYFKRNFTLAWVDDFGLKPEASILINAIRNSEPKHLLNEVYPFKTIGELATNAICMVASGGSIAPNLAAKLDYALSTAFFLHSIQTMTGTIIPAANKKFEADWLQYRQNINEVSDYLIGKLENALANHSFALLITQIEPQHQDYLRLKAAKKRYETIVTGGGWPHIPEDGSVLRKGERNIRVALLRKRLAASGDLNAVYENEPDYFDDILEQAVKHFQIRHNLIADGVAGQTTLRTLNVPARRRLEQIMVNLERWRQMPRNLGERYIEVNIPNYFLKVVDHGKVVQSMRVVVGRKNRPTPILAGQITYVEVNPYWNIPPKIAKKDILPKILQDPSYLTRKNIRVFASWQAAATELNPQNINWKQVGENHFPYKLRQEPDAANALGRVKFIFPNKLSVYLHDTPSKELFQRKERSFSSGCVRVEKPLDLAAYLLDVDSGWDKPKLDHILDEGSPKVILLKKPVPVYLLYWTAWVQDDGTINFRNDIYGQDNAMAQQIEKEVESIRKCQSDIATDPLMSSNVTLPAETANNI